MEDQTQQNTNPEAARPHGSSIPLVIGVVLILGVLVGSLLYWRSRTSSSTTPNTETAKNGTSTAEDTRKKLIQLGLSADGRTFNGAGDVSLADDALSELAHVPTLREVNIEGCSVVTGDGLSHLKQLGELERLNLRRVSLRDGELEFLSGLTNLRTLDLGLNEELTDAGMSHLHGLARLETLSLEGCTRLTDKGLMVLKQLKTLRELDLSWCSGPSAQGVRVLIDALPNLAVLRLAHTQHGDELLKAFDGLSGLEILDLTSTPNISEEALRQFKSTHGNLVIVR